MAGVLFWNPKGSFVMENEEALREAVRSALSGQAILFLGAGAAKDAVRSDGNRLPTGRELADDLAHECGLGDGYDLDAISEHFVDHVSEAALIEALKRKLAISSIGDCLSHLGDIPWLRVWTTNYDDAIERALDAHTHSYYSLTTSADVRNAQGNRLIVLHINGKIDGLNAALTQDFVLTSQGYATSTFVGTEWATVFKNDLKQCKAIIFVGYSLADIDVARLVFDPATFHRKVHFVDQLEMDPVLRTKLDKFGVVHSIGLDRLAEIISEERHAWVAPKLVEEYQSWKPLEIEKSSNPPSDDDFYELILNGVCKPDLLLDQLEAPQFPSYTIVRSVEAKCLSQLSEKDSVALLVGSFANGKTLSSNSIGLQLVASGRDVFVLDHPYDIAGVELQRLCRREDSFVLILENYSRNLRFVELFCRYARSDCALLLTERTEVHELSGGALLERIGSRSLKEYSLDILDNEELRRISELWGLRGLWGERAGLSDLQKMGFLKDECGRQLQAVLIEVAKSPQVQAKLAEIVRHFESIPGGLRMLIGLCLFQAIGEQPRIDSVSELLDFSFADFRRLRTDSIVRQIVDVGTSGVAQFRSPIMASAVLNGLSGAAVVTDVVEECVKRGHHARRADPYLGTIAKELMRFGNLERILPERGKRAALQNLYEGLKSVSSIREHPHFWLQYAMVRLSLGELDIARRYFEQSYSYAKKLENYDTFQIDNHYCRLLLREAEDTADPDQAFKRTDEALATLKRQVLRENRHYPYRSAWNLEAVTKRHGGHWTEAQKKSVVSAASYLIDASARLDPQIARSVAVVGGVERLRRVVKVLE